MSALHQNNDESTLTSSTSEESTTETQKKGDPFFKEVLKFALIAILIVVPIRLYIAQPFIVSGASMDPAFATGEYLIIDQVTYHFDDPKRGEVIIFRFPNDPSKFFIKRVIGLPNETVEIRGTEVVVRAKDDIIGIELDEPYVDEKNQRSVFSTTVLEEDEYFVMGDNRRASSDSRIWGPVERNLIVGRPIVRLLPPATYLPGVATYTTQ